MVDLSGRVVVVTGAGRGLGRAHAISLARAGAAVVVSDLPDPDHPAENVVGEIIGEGHRAVAVHDDITTVRGASAIVGGAVEAFGRLDALVNNAGVTDSAPLDRMSAATFDRVVAVHLRGTFCMTRAALRQMQAQGGGGRIVNTSSGAGLHRVQPGIANYAAAKAAVAALTQVTAREGEAHGITCNAIIPLARTRMTGDDYPGFAERPALVDPFAISPLVVYLVSGESTGITGELIQCRLGRLSALRWMETAGVEKADAPWTADEIAARIDEILGR